MNTTAKIVTTCDKLIEHIKTEYYHKDVLGVFVLSAIVANITSMIFPLWVVIWGALVAGMSFLIRGAYLERKGGDVDQNKCGSMCLAVMFGAMVVWSAI